ncbi:hypothetical protein PGT21_022572 [Puccinia graminis f. sp. tritici]|uniref:CCAAT-binding factor domain-containing protein n=1 Tax=Puccinia graminis f. sp. tritici TaxID=56615 RepID=A0A5B0LW62_PUCGR|nr:hypothetical protein PGT21_022572 [Puccinia graminis f. sp. tritici]KAA1137315.1 hypothetical protein PGTUg99_004594 [Puccinia graminis f. sp. tritici]
MAIKSIPTKTNSTATTTTNKQHRKTIKQTLKQIKETEQQLKQTTNQDLNPIADLLERLEKEVKAATEEEEEEQNKKTKKQATTHQVTHALIYALHRVFSSLIRQGRIHGSPTRTKAQEGPEEEAIKLVKEWLKTQYSQYIDCLLVLLHLSTTQEEQGTQIELDALTILINLVRAESDIIRALKYPSLPEISAKFPPAGFESATFLKLVKTLLIPTLKLPPIPQSVRAEFILRYLNFCDDLRFRFLKDATFLCQSSNPESVQQGRKKKKAKTTVPTDNSNGDQNKGLTRNLLMYLESLTTMPTREEELDQFWTGKPEETSAGSMRMRKRTRGGKEGAGGQKKKTQKTADGSTGIFDDPSDSEASGPEALELAQEPRGLGKNQQHPLLSLRAHQRAFSDCWIAFLSRQDLAESDIKRILNLLHDQVIPHMIDPKILMDFLVDCLDYGGSISVLSLNALFTLISKHNLDYPDFYTRLYALLDSSIMHTRHRPRFFRMLEVFLSSTHLPVNIVASFVKKIARLSLFAPPAATITVVPFCYNLIKLHPTVMALLHRLPDPNTKSLKALPINDPFKLDEPDPLKTDAIFSSAWELVGLRSHYLASISTLFKVFQESFDKPKYDLEDFLDHSYSTLIDTELTRMIKKPPALSLFSISYKEPASSLTTSAPSGSKKSTVVVDDIVNQMWKI